MVGNGIFNGNIAQYITTTLNSPRRRPTTVGHISLSVAPPRKCQPAVRAKEPCRRWWWWWWWWWDSADFRLSKYAIDKDLPHELLPRLYPTLSPMGPAQSDDWLPRRPRHLCFKFRQPSCRWTLGPRGLAENEPMTNKCAYNYQPITNDVEPATATIAGAASFSR